MASDPAPDTTASLREPAAQIRAQLESRFWHLRFPPPLEQEFIAFLRESQRNIQLVLGGVALLMIVGFSLTDFALYGPVRDTPAAPAFLWGVFLPRWLCIASLVAGLVWGGPSDNLRLRTFTVAGLFAIVGVTTFITTAVYGNLGLPNVTTSYALIIVAAFMPCGLLFRESLALGLLLWAAGLAVVQLVLEPGHAEPGWLLVSMMLVALVLAMSSAYMREHALREQFLLRSLVDWEAGHDPLTGLANRRALALAVPTVLRQAAREKVPVALAVIDVDHFKAYNDHYGHQGGDEVLRQLAQHLAGYARRPLDLAVRMGGEEFALLCYGEGAESLAGRMRQMQAGLRAQALPHAESPVAAHVTVSAGVAGLPVVGAGKISNDDAAAVLDALYRDADALLYRAKNEGRDRVVC
ncbi:GGDEF domain-containing protein [Acidovorax sp. NCPPB 4044]|uniref:GGDEF domain-containing protein n=1 Tax=Acidovorax sp. NCPPB 4044 TaxID=2940490 RepID=UPI002303D9C8|nr:GGDEF domain-containing protein [Acidovorax sp. NCPPB 4044]MDA8523329.1 GGDEF domain-containing protein [Acidovorax sp. NCPPB 4044]